MQEAYRRLHAGESDLDIEYRIVRPDGETRFVRELGTLVRDESGKPVAASMCATADSTSARETNAWPSFLAQ